MCGPHTCVPDGHLHSFTGSPVRFDEKYLAICRALAHDVQGSSRAFHRVSVRSCLWIPIPAPSLSLVFFGITRVKGHTHTHTHTHASTAQEGTKHMKIQALMLILDEHNAEGIIKELQRIVRGFQMVCMCPRLFGMLVDRTD